MKRMRKSAGSIILLLMLTGCAAPLRTDTTTFRLPTQYPNHQEIDGLELAVVPVAGVERSRAVFGTDMHTAGILPVQIIAQNKGSREFEVNAAQMFGMTPNGELTVAYTLRRSAERVRESSIGATAATQAAVGAIAGAAAGAAIGAAASGASGGDAGSGAAAGAAIGGAVGAGSGAAAGLSDAITVQFKKELAAVAFEDRVVYPGDLQQGFIYFKWKPYTQVRVKVFNITTGETREMVFDVRLAR